MLPLTAISIRRLHVPAELDAFVAHLAPSDIYARFGRIVASDRVASLLLPNAAGCTAIAACLDGEIVGTAVLAELSDRCAEIAVLVRADFRDRGVAAALVREALRRARISGIAQVVAQVDAGNVAAMRLLRSASFRPAPSQGGELLLVAVISPQAHFSEQACRDPSAELIGATGPIAWISFAQRQRKCERPWRTPFANTFRATTPSRRSRF